MHLVMLKSNRHCSPVSRGRRGMSSGSPSERWPAGSATATRSNTESDAKSIASLVRRTSAAASADWARSWRGRVMLCLGSLAVLIWLLWVVPVCGALIDVAVVTVLLFEGLQIVVRRFRVHAALMGHYGVNCDVHILLHPRRISAYVDTCALLQPRPEIPCLFEHPVLHVELAFLVT